MRCVMWKCQELDDLFMGVVWVSEHPLCPALPRTSLRHNCHITVISYNCHITAISSVQGEGFVPLFEQPCHIRSVTSLWTAGYGAWHIRVGLAERCQGWHEFLGNWSHSVVCAVHTRGKPIIASQCFAYLHISSDFQRQINLIMIFKKSCFQDYIMWRDTWDLSRLVLQFKVCHWVSSPLPFSVEHPLRLQRLQHCHKRAISQSATKPRQEICGDLPWFSHRICLSMGSNGSSSMGEHRVQWTLLPFLFAQACWHRMAENIRGCQDRTCQCCRAFQKHLRSSWEAAGTAWTHKLRILTVTANKPATWAYNKIQLIENWYRPAVICVLNLRHQSCSDTWPGSSRPQRCSRFWAEFAWILTLNRSYPFKLPSGGGECQEGEEEICHTWVLRWPRWPKECERIAGTYEDWPIAALLSAEDPYAELTDSLKARPQNWWLTLMNVWNNTLSLTATPFTPVFTPDFT